MNKLLQHDIYHRIKLIDIYSKEFSEIAPELTQDNALSTIHGIYQNKLIQGIDVNYWAWALVGKKHWVLWIKMPFFRQLLILFYRLFALFRPQISMFFTKVFNLKAKQCLTGHCYGKKTPNHWRK